MTSVPLSRGTIERSELGGWRDVLRSTDFGLRTAALDGREGGRAFFAAIFVRSYITDMTVTADAKNTGFGEVLHHRCRFTGR